MLNRGTYGGGKKEKKTRKNTFDGTELFFLHLRHFLPVYLLHKKIRLFYAIFVLVLTYTFP